MIGREPSEIGTTCQGANTPTGTKRPGQMLTGEQSGQSGDSRDSRNAVWRRHSLEEDTREEALARCWSRRGLVPGHRRKMSLHSAQR